MNSRAEVIDLTLDDDEFVTPPSTSQQRRYGDIRSAQRFPPSSWDGSAVGESGRAFNERITNFEAGHPSALQDYRPPSRNPRLEQNNARSQSSSSIRKSTHSPVMARSPPIPRNIAGVSPSSLTSPRGKNITEKRRRACTFCIAQGEAASCDGGRPCSACFEPNPDGCEYLDETPQSFDRSPIAYRNGITQHASERSVPDYHFVIGSPGRSGIPAKSQLPRNISWMLSSDEPTIQNSVENNPTASYNTTKSSAYAIPLETEDPAPPTPVDFDEVKAILKQHEDRMRAHREYILKPQLVQARLHCQKTPGACLSGPDLNPFAALIEQKAASSTTNSDQPSEADHYAVKTHRGNGSKRFIATKIPIQRFKAQDNVPVLPKYRSIGRLGNSFLTRNVHTLKYMPYFADDEQYDSSQDEKEVELKQRYKSDDAELIKQRKCRELVFLWRPWLLDFIRDMNLSYLDILYYLVTDVQLRCKVCDTKPMRGGRRQAARLKDMLTTPGDDVLQRAKWGSDALLETVGIGIWHVLEDMSEIRDALRQSYSGETKGLLTAMCSVCFLFDCQTHGAYFDADDDMSERDVMIDDSETENNVKQPAKTSLPNKNRHHQCGFYCIAFSGSNYPPTTFWGLRSDGKINGLKNPSLRIEGQARFADDKICGEYCFWEVERRRQYHQDHLSVKCANISATQRDILHTFIRVYASNPRAPCMIARLAKIPCMSVFYEMLTVMSTIPHPSTHSVDGEDEDESLSDQGTRKVSRVAAGFDTSNSRKLDARQPFVPCSHEGPCLDCSCAHDNVHCEHFCGCDESCKRRFQGCRCKGRACFNDDRCECWANNRECDPWLCGNCGVVEVLDPNNKYRDDIREGRCQNNRIQLDLPARTIKAPSEVQGWGLYAGQDLEANTFIGEYKGEVISVREGDRRGVVYHNIGQEYLFITNADQQIDGSRFGNKTRFMNNSQLDKNINVLAKNLLSNGVQKVMFYTKKPVKAGEELLYNYNYPDHVVKHFWERGENPVDSQGVVTPMVKPRIMGRFTKMVAGKHDGEESTARKQEHATLRREKKKRQREEEDWSAESVVNDTEQNGQEADFFRGMATVSRSRHHPSNESDDDDDESEVEFWEQGDPQEGSDGGDEEGDDEDEGDTGFRPGSRRRRQMQAIDRRRGGLAQKRAWETRRKNNRG